MRGICAPLFFFQNGTPTHCFDGDGAETFIPFTRGLRKNVAALRRFRWCRMCCRSIQDKSHVALCTRARCRCPAHGTYEPGWPPGRDLKTTCAVLPPRPVESVLLGVGVHVSVVTSFWAELWDTREKTHSVLLCSILLVLKLCWTTECGCADTMDEVGDIFL